MCPKLGSAGHLAVFDCLNTAVGSCDAAQGDVTMANLKVAYTELCTEVFPQIVSPVASPGVDNCPALDTCVVSLDSFPDFTPLINLQPETIPPPNAVGDALYFLGNTSTTHLWCSWLQKHYECSITNAQACGLSGSAVDMLTKRKTALKDNCEGDGGTSAGVDSLQQNVFLAAGDSIDAEMVSAAAAADNDAAPININDPVFFSPNSMGSHARIHDKDRPQVLRCEFEGCGKEFDRLCRLKQHVRQHTGEKPYICHFEGCTWAFTTASKLKRHQAKHLGLRKFQCPMCSKGFMRAEHLKGHMVTHSGVKPFACPVEGCDVSFTAKSSLYVHLTKHDKDGNKLTFHCPMDGCSKKYSTKVALRNHIFKHYLSTESDGNQLPCPMEGCDKTFGTKLALRNHIFQHYLSTTEGSAVSGQEAAQLLMAAQVAMDSGTDEQEQGTEEAAGSSCLSVSDSEPSTQLEEGGVEISCDQLTSAAVTQLMSSPVTIDAGPAPVPQTSANMLKISLDPKPSRVRLENRSGSARTDYQSNHMLSNRARRRWHQQRDHSQNIASVDAPLPSVHIQGNDDSNEKDMSLLKQDADTFVSPDSSLSGLTFRDPETGITYVQTQLLQDGFRNIHVSFPDGESERPVEKPMRHESANNAVKTIRDGKM
nr:hypothetical protein BaRGS_023639 [Batillaria attramentaria]